MSRLPRLDARREGTSGDTSGLVARREETPDSDESDDEREFDGPEDSDEEDEDEGEQLRGY